MNPAVYHVRDRWDAPPLARRGNAVFASATFDDTGTLLITRLSMANAGVQVWNAETGALLRSIPAAVIPDKLWMIDSRRLRLLAAKSGEPGLHVFDLRTGEDLAKLPEGPEGLARSTRAAGLAGGGNEVLLFTPGWLEVWQLDPPAFLRRVTSPLPAEHYYPGCVGGIPFTYTDKTCVEWSPDRQTLAMAYTPVFSPMSESHFVLVDVATLEIRELTLPTARKDRTLAAFAFSPDGRRLAIGTDRELLIYDRTSDQWGPTILGDNQRNKYLGAMRFTGDGRRVVALGDLLQVSVYDVETGARVGRNQPHSWDWEGEFRVSQDGSRIAIYHFVSDVFEVLDGRDAHRVGWVCPYFCNARHNPVQPPYALSPDGRSLVALNQRGTAVWDVATDRLKFALHDPRFPPLQGPPFLH